MGSRTRIHGRYRQCFLAIGIQIEHCPNISIQSKKQGMARNEGFSASAPNHWSYGGSQPISTTRLSGSYAPWGSAANPNASEAERRGDAKASITGSGPVRRGQSPGAASRAETDAAPRMSRFRLSRRSNGFTRCLLLPLRRREEITRRV